MKFLSYIFMVALMMATSISSALAVEWVAQPNHQLSDGRDYGERNIGGGASSFHAGEDIYSGGQYRNQPFYTSHGGTVSTGTMRGYGNTITVTNGHVRTLYGHANGYTVENGSDVNAGDNIGLVGNTGNTVGRTGVHLHYEIQVYDTTTGRWDSVDPTIARGLINAGYEPGSKEFTAAALSETRKKHGRTKADKTGRGVPGSPGNGSKTGKNASGEQCSPEMRNIAEQLQNMRSQRANEIITSSITQPTSVAQMSCVDQLAAQYSSQIGKIFTDPIMGLANTKFPDVVQKTFLGTVVDNFMGSALSGIQSAVNTVISDTISSVAGAILPGVGGALGNLFGGGAKFDCKIMKAIWDLVQCAGLPKFPSLFDLDFGGSFLQRPDSCEGRVLYDTALDMLNNTGLARQTVNASAQQSKALNKAIRCSVGAGRDCR